MDTVIPARDGNQEMHAEDPEEDTPRGGQQDTRPSEDNFENDAAVMSCTAYDEAALLLFPRFVQPQDQPLADFVKKMNENNVGYELCSYFGV